MSEVEKYFKDGETDDLVIHNHERLMLIDVLGLIAGVLQAEKLWFNQKGLKHNQQYIDFCKLMAKKFSNLKVNQEQ